MNNRFLPKSTSDFLLFVALICLGSSISAKQTDPDEQQSNYVYDDSGEDDQAEEQIYIFQNSIPASQNPLYAVRIILEFIGSDGESNEKYVEPLAMGDPNTYTETLLDDSTQNLTNVNLKTLVHDGEEFTENSVGSYDPTYFEQPGTFEFWLDESGNIVLEKEGNAIPLFPAA